MRNPPEPHSRVLHCILSIESTLYMYERNDSADGFAEELTRRFAEELQDDLAKNLWPWLWNSSINPMILPPRA